MVCVLQSFGIAVSMCIVWLALYRLSKSPFRHFAKRSYWSAWGSSKAYVNLKIAILLHGPKLLLAARSEYKGPVPCYVAVCIATGRPSDIRSCEYSCFPELSAIRA